MLVVPNVAITKNPVLNPTGKCAIVSCRTEIVYAPYRHTEQRDMSMAQSGMIVSGCDIVAISFGRKC
jgi:hypothetical protein